MELYTKRICNSTPYSVLHGGPSVFFGTYAIDADNAIKRSLSKRDDKTHKVVGGNSPWGAILDMACSRYGWTFHYAMWEISLVNLQMMLADQITVLYIDKNSKNNTFDDGIELKAEKASIAQARALYD
jgi:hypothetical protein